MAWNSKIQKNSSNELNFYKESKLHKEAAKGYSDYVFDTFISPVLGKGEGTFRKNTGGIGKAGSHFKNATDEYANIIKEKGYTAIIARNAVDAYVADRHPTFKKDYQRLELRAKRGTEEFQNGLKNFRHQYQVPSGLIEKVKESYQDLMMTDFNVKKENNVIGHEQVYEDLILPEFYKNREKGEIIFIYAKNSFSVMHNNHDEINDPLNQLRHSIETRTQKVDVNGKIVKKKKIVGFEPLYLKQVIEGMTRLNDLKLGELQSQSLYEVSESTKAVRSFHEFAVRDILAICGVNFDLEVPIKIYGSTLYKDDPVIDFVLPGQELFEIFGDSRGNYADRKAEKIDKLPNLWYVDYGDKMSRLGLGKRTITMYCESLNTQCYNNRSKEPTAGALQGKDYVETVNARLPLLEISHMAKLDFYWQWAMKLPAETLMAIRDKIKEIQRSPDLNPLPMATAQIDMQGFGKKLPTIKEIHEELLSGSVADGASSFSFPDGGGFSSEFIGNISGQELIALYFQTPEAIMPYLEEISNQLDGNQSPEQEVEIQEDTQPYDFSDYSTSVPDASLQEQNEEPRLLAANSNRNVKTASIELSEKDFNTQIKDLIQRDPFFEQLFSLYEVPISAVENDLSFHIVNLDGRHAKSSENDIYINSQLMKINDSVEDILHFVVHEVTHWLTRQREKMCYFSDPEELEAFAIGMSFELRRGQSEEEIRKIYFPIIKAHFKEEGQAEEMYKEFLKSAYILNKNIFN